jgi:hypothetical protein
VSCPTISCCSRSPCHPSHLPRQMGRAQQIATAQTAASHWSACPLPFSNNSPPAFAALLCTFWANYNLTPLTLSTSNSTSTFAPQGLPPTPCTSPPSSAPPPLSPPVHALKRLKSLPLPIFAPSLPLQSRQHRLDQPASPLA